MTTVYCQQCGRANGVSSRKCLWCAAIIGGSSSTEVDTTTLEVDYVSGIDRLDNPGPARMVISSEGIEIAEILPGSRSFKIPAACITDVNVTASTLAVEPPEHPWWRRMVKSLRGTSKQPANESIQPDYLFTVTYVQDNEIGTVVFRRYDPNGNMPVWRIADTLGRLTGQCRGSPGSAVNRLYEKP
jgi:hypothetical protein